MSIILEYVGHTAIFDNLPQLAIGAFNSLLNMVITNSDSIWGSWVALMAFILAAGFLYMLWKLPLKMGHYVLSLLS